VASATLANKALEVIEAHYLFQMAYRDISVVVHPQSVVHSMVEFVDGSVMAQMGFPTMELPILYALTHPERLSDPELRSFDPVRSSPLTFERVDDEGFPLFGIGVRAGREGGTAPTVFNAANEIAVGAFLQDHLPFQGMTEVVGETLARVPSAPVRELRDVLEADGAARRVAQRLVERRLPTVPGSDA
jgi:1-deoxy-D-xylulose-5-phosphate reductoisomerase